MSVGKLSLGPQQDIPSFRPATWSAGCQTASAKRLSKVKRLACLGITRAIRTGATCPPSAGSIDTGGGEVGGTSPLGFWGLGLTFTTIKDIVAH